MPAAKRLLVSMFAAAVVLAACGDDGGDGGSKADSDDTRTSGDVGDAGASGDDEEAVEDTITTWLLEGGCDLMTDDFLEEQAFIGDDREERCEFFEDSFIEPQFDEDDIVISHVEVDDDEASAVVGDDFSNVESTYELVKSDGQWQIDSVDIGTSDST